MEQPTLSRQVYISCSQTSEESTATMLRRSRLRNVELGITGGLIYTGHYFFQVLEGPADHVQSMMEKIAVDPRHHSMKPVLNERPAVRQFSLWSMGFAALPFADQLIVPLFTLRDDDRARMVTGLMLQTIRREQGVH